MKNSKPIPNHPYHNKTDDELRYIIKDASEAARAMRGVNPASESKYLDQVNDASTVLHYRKVVKEGVDLDEGTRSAVGAAAMAAVIGGALGAAKDWKSEEDAAKEVSAHIAQMKTVPFGKRPEDVGLVKAKELAKKIRETK